MQLNAMTDSQAKNYRVYLDGRIVPYALAASEEDGWVEVIDTRFIGMVAPITQESGSISNMQLEETDVKTKKLFGKVELKLIPLKR